VCVAAGLAAVSLCGLLPMTRLSLLLGTLVYGAVLGLALTPAVVLAAWADRVKAPTLPPSSAARSASPVPPR
jgi:hypothetical protein